MSIVIKSRSIQSEYKISGTCEINLSPLLINLLFMQALWFPLTKLGIRSCNLFARDFDTNLVATLIKR